MHKFTTCMGLMREYSIHQGKHKQLRTPKSGISITATPSQNEKAYQALRRVNWVNISTNQADSLMRVVQVAPG